MYQPYEVWKISNILKAIFVIYDQIVSMVIQISYRCIPGVSEQQWRLSPTNNTSIKCLC